MSGPLTVACRKRAAAIRILPLDVGRRRSAGPPTSLFVSVSRPSAVTASGVIGADRFATPKVASTVPLTAPLNRGFAAIRAGSKPLELAGRAAAQIALSARCASYAIRGSVPPNTSESVAVPVASMRICSRGRAAALHVERGVDPAVVFGLRERGDLEGLADTAEVQVAHLAARGVGQRLQSGLPRTGRHRELPRRAARRSCRRRSSTPPSSRCLRSPSSGPTEPLT